MLSWARRDQTAHTLILITPGQQLVPEFFVHAVIPPRHALRKKDRRVTLGRMHRAHSLP